VAGGRHVARHAEEATPLATRRQGTWATRRGAAPRPRVDRALSDAPMRRCPWRRDGAGRGRHARGAAPKMGCGQRVGDALMVGRPWRRVDAGRGRHAVARHPGGWLTARCATRRGGDALGDAAAGDVGDTPWAGTQTAGGRRVERRADGATLVSTPWCGTWAARQNGGAQDGMWTARGRCAYGATPLATFRRRTWATRRGAAPRWLADGSFGDAPMGRRTWRCAGSGRGRHAVGGGARGAGIGGASASQAVNYEFTSC